MINNKNKNIFIAEDESMILMTYQMMLEDAGYSVIGTARNGKIALKKIQELKPDLVLMDINMPGLSGIDVMEELPKSMIVPCVFITAHYSSQLVKMINDIGAFGYLVKPVNENQLIAMVEVALNRAADYKNAKHVAITAKIALAHRKTVEKAKGILMDNFGVKESDAMKIIQKKSRDTNTKLVEVAQKIIDSSQML